MTKSFALALGGGGARGLAHIAVLEALDEIGAKPAAIAATSSGALLAAAYAAGISGRDIRRFVIALAHDRGEVFRRLVASRASTFASLFSIGLGSAALLDAEKFCRQFLPEPVPEQFEELRIPLAVVATDLYRRRQAVFSAGPLIPALAASIALPTLMRPVVVERRVLIDGAATNPLPFDALPRHADIIIAVDITGVPSEERVPCARTSCASSLVALSQLSMRTGFQVCTIIPPIVSGVSGNRAPTGTCLPSRPQPAIVMFCPSAV